MRTAPASARRCRRSAAGRAPRGAASPPARSRGRRRSPGPARGRSRAVDEAEHVGVDHAGAEDLDPALPLAEVAALARRQRAVPSHWKQETSTSTLGSVKGKKWGRSRTSRSSPKIARQSASRVPLQVGEGQPLGDRQPLHLVEHRAVGGVGVAPVDLAGDDDEDRRRLRLHRAHLHRRGVGAQQHVRVGLDVEGVLEHPRRVAGRVVEGGEVVVVVLDLRPFGDPVAEPDHDVLDQPRGAGDQVRVADRARRRPGQGDVDPVARPAAAPARRRRARPRAAPAAPPAPCGPCWRRRRPRPVPRRQLGDPAQDRGQLGFAAEVADPQLLQLGARGGGLDRRRGLALISSIRSSIGPSSRIAGDDIRSRRRSPPRRRR